MYTVFVVLLLTKVERLFDNVKGSRAMDFDALIDKYSKVKPGLA